MRILSLLLTLIFNVSASIPNVGENQPGSQGLDGANSSVVQGVDREMIHPESTLDVNKECESLKQNTFLRRKNPHIVFPPAISDRYLLAPQYSDSSDSSDCGIFFNNCATSSEENSLNTSPLSPRDQDKQPRLLIKSYSDTYITLAKRAEQNAREARDEAGDASSSESRSSGAMESHEDNALTSSPSNARSRDEAGDASPSDSRSSGAVKNRKDANLHEGRNWADYTCSSDSDSSGSTDSHEGNSLNTPPLIPEDKDKQPNFLTSSESRSSDAEDGHEENSLTSSPSNARSRDEADEASSSESDSSGALTSEEDMDSYGETSNLVAEISARKIRSHEVVNTASASFPSDIGGKHDPIAPGATDGSRKTISADQKGEEIILTLPKFLQDIEKAQVSSSSLVVNSAEANDSHEKINPYEGMPWADYPCSSDSNSSGETSSDEEKEEEIITPTSIPDVQRRGSLCQGLGASSIRQILSSGGEISSTRSTAISIQEDRPYFKGLGSSSIRQVMNSREISSTHSTATNIHEDKLYHKELSNGDSSEVKNNHEDIPSESYLDLNDSYSNKAVYSEHSEVENTPISDEYANLDYDSINSSDYSDVDNASVSDKPLLLSKWKVYYKTIQYRAYHQLLSILCRIKDAIVAYPDYFLTSKDKILLERLGSSLHPSITKKHRQVLRNVIDGIGISYEEIKSLRSLMDNKLLDPETKDAIESILERREFNKYEEQILTIIKPLNPKQRKFLLSLVNVTTSEVIAIPFDSGYILDVSSEEVETDTDDANTSNTTGDFVAVGGQSGIPEDWYNQLYKELYPYSPSDHFLSANEVVRYKIILNYNDYCWINNQLFPQGFFNQGLAKILCATDSINDSDMLFAKLVRRLIKTLDLKSSIEFLCKDKNIYGVGLNIFYDEMRSIISPMEDKYTKKDVFDAIRGMLSKHAEVIAKYSTDYAEALNQFQNYILHVMRSGQIIQYISNHSVLRLYGCKLIEGLDENEVIATVKAYHDIMGVISGEVIERRAGFYQLIPNHVIARFAEDVWNDVICRFKM